MKLAKGKCDIMREYAISESLLDKWIKQSQTISKQYKLIRAI